MKLKKHGFLEPIQKVFPCKEVSMHTITVRYETAITFERIEKWKKGREVQKLWRVRWSWPDFLLWPSLLAQAVWSRVGRRSQQ